MRLTKRDMKILMHIGKRRAVSITQLQRVFFPNYRTAARRLLSLEKEGLINRRPLPNWYGLATWTEKTWEFICFLSNQGRRVIAAEMGVGVSEVPSHTVDVRTRHILTVSDVMDWLKMEGDVEVKVRTDGSSFVIADAVGTIPGLKASRYMRLAQYKPVPLLLVVTQRPKHVVKEFTKSIAS